MPGRSALRIRICAVVFAMLFLAVGARLAYLQIVKGDYYLDKAVRQQSRRIVIPAMRGTIFDRKKRVIGISLPVESLYVDPSAVAPGDLTFVATRLSRITALEAGWIASRITEKRNARFLWIKRHLSEYQAQLVRALMQHKRARGVGLRREFRRKYPQGKLFCHVLGFTDVDCRGLEGVERFFDEDLTGTDGFRIVEADGLNQKIVSADAVEVEPRDGNNLVLTVDIRIQTFARDALKKLCKEFAPVSATAVVLEAKTGEVLALCNQPEFDPNDPAGYPVEARKNHAVVSVYEPGSTFKPFVAAAALQRKLVSLDTKIFCENGIFRAPGGRILHDHHAMGTLSFVQVVAKSSNIGMAKIGLMLGARGVYEAVRAFGFGRRTGIELPGERTGWVKAVDKWSGYTITSIPMGQEVTVTPLQLAVAFNAFATGGVYVRPALFRAFLDGEGKTLIAFRHSTEGRRVLGPDIARKMVDPVLRSVVSRQGTGRRAILKRWSSFGKTGTAQKVDPATRRFSHEKFVASFVCSGPVGNPQVTVLVMVDEPRKGPSYYGGVVAAPAAAEILKKTLQYLQVPPDKPVEVAYER